ncbi:MAG: S9 family peptidase [Thermoanaerobaculaceae bacterium]|nr:S9 family peptidase [Thermoanaerobaculaceae bacterium]MDI9621263.1 prolyl oligopeptidase family serine peptidase [Acidobacteriota bacterium]NLH11916.1 S9 family peptidase [Holophagae bacterium]HPW54205.1 prolyl oligopeptidase family serine peptidase [Thermoanaerobaculaceae bacterium]
MRFRPLIAFAASFQLASLALAAGAASSPAAKEKPTASVAVSRWLMLGPAPLPLPAFGADKRGGYGPSELLKAALLPPLEAAPRAGTRIPWLGATTLEWKEVVAGKDGLVTVANGAASTPRAAWLAASVEVPRWQTLELELFGSSAQRLLVDGTQVAAGGGTSAGGDGKGTVKLLPGSHLLVVQAITEPDRTGTWTAGVRLSAPSRPDLELATSPERTLDILDILDRTDVSSLAVSPDGALVAVTLRRIVPGTDDSESWIEVRSTADGAVRWSRRGAETSSAAWAAPRLLGFTTADRKGKNGSERALSTLWIADLESGGTTPLLERIEDLGGYRWAAGAEAVVYWTTARADPDRRGIKLVESIVDRQKGFRDKTYLWLARGRDGARVRLTAGELSSRVEDIAADGSRLLFTRQIEDLTARPYYRTELWEMDLATLAANKLRDFRWLAGASYGPPGRLLVVAGPSEFGAAGTVLPAGVTPNDGDGQLYLWDPQADGVEPLSRELDPSILGAEWSQAAGAVIVLAAVKDEVGVLRLDLATKRYERLDTGSAVITNSSLAKAAPTLVVAGSSPWRPERVEVLDLSSGSSKVLFDPASGWWPAIRPGRVEPWRCTVASGIEIDGRVYLPPDFDPAKKYPAIVNYYAGTTPINQAFGGRYPKEWWAALGYVVYVPQPSGAIGYGQAHSARHVNEWGSLVVDEIIDATKQFLAAHPYVDGKRVGCIGASYGGFTTMSLVTRTDLFAAAVSHAGISSISSYWGEGYWGYTYNARSAADSFPWNRPDLYVGQSPLFAADKVKTPLLLTHGQADTNVPVGESDSFFTALKLLGAPVEYLQVEGQDHMILEHAKRIVWSRAIVAWFERYLKGEPGWWEDLKAAPKKEKGDPNA